MEYVIIFWGKSSDSRKIFSVAKEYFMNYDMVPGKRFM
jgi:hypothetical protein